MNEWIEIILHNDVCKQSEQVMRFFGKNKNRFKQMNERTNGWMNEQVNPRTVTPIIVHKIAIKVKLKWFTQLEFSIECIDWKVIAKLMHSKLFQDNEDFVRAIVLSILQLNMKAAPKYPKLQNLHQSFSIAQYDDRLIHTWNSITNSFNWRYRNDKIFHKANMKCINYQ